MHISKTEMQIRSEALDSIEKAISKMNLKLGRAKGFRSTDPESYRRQRRIKGTLNRIEFEVLLARSGIEESEDREMEIKQDRLATVLHFAR